MNNLYDIYVVSVLDGEYTLIEEASGEQVGEPVDRELHGMDAVHELYAQCIAMNDKV